jgi:ribosomal protein L14
VSTTNVTPPFPLFTDNDGAPLDNGFVYIGTANMNPVSNPIAVFWDSALTISASQPIRTINGFPSRNGSPGVLFVGSDYSITVKDKNGVQQLTNPSGARAGLGSIVLAATESLTAESGSSILLEDGSVMEIGDATGTGVTVTFASNARVVGNVLPNATGTQALGSTARRWDVFGDTVNAVDVVASGTMLGAAIGGTNVTGYIDDTSPATATEALTLNQQKNIVACGRVSSTGVVATNHFNITSATNSLGVAVVTLDQAIEDDAVVIAQPTGTTSGLEVRAAVAAGGATITFTQFQATVATSLNFTFLAIGRPRGGVPDPV